MRVCALRTLWAADGVTSSASPPRVLHESCRPHVLVCDGKQYGKEGLEGGGGGGGAEDILSAFFGGGGGRRRGPTGPRKGPSVRHPLKVSLADLYKGKTARLAVTRDVLCEVCDGKGGSREATCSTCGGHGQVIQVRRMGNMVQQMQTTCPKCRGTGTDMAEEDKCKSCNGRKVKRAKKTLEVHIEPGMKHGQKIVFPGEADAKPGYLPGDMVFVIQEKEDARFKRNGSNLVYQHRITLREALVGSQVRRNGVDTTCDARVLTCCHTRQFVLEHLDGRKLLVKTPPGMVVKPGSLKGIRGEGMPLKGNQFTKVRATQHLCSCR